MEEPPGIPAAYRSPQPTVDVLWAEPWAPSWVVAAMSTHSPTSGRARCTSRSTLTNDHVAQSSSAEMPLAESAMRPARVEGFNREVPTKVESVHAPRIGREDGAVKRVGENDFRVRTRAVVSVQAVGTLSDEGDSVQPPALPMRIPAMKTSVPPTTLRIYARWER